jgi:uncharacterized protein
MKIPVLVMMLVLIAPVVAIAQPMSQPAPKLPPVPVIEVTGTAEVRANPDRANMDIAVETHAKDAAQAAAENARLSQKIAAALKAKLGDTGKIQTGSYNLMPDYRQLPNEVTSQIIGFRAENTVSVETTALDRVGPMIDAAIGAGANRIDSVSFSLRDESGPRNEAIAKAASDAVGQARALAAALGVKLRRVLRASTNAEQPPIRFARAMPQMAMAAESAPTPITPGQITVPATVYLTYEIE